MLPSLLDDADGRFVHRRATQLQRSRAHRPLALVDEVGVAVDHPDLVDRDAQLLAGERREGGVEALPVRRAAGVDGGGPVGLHLHLGELLAGLRPGGDLDVGRHADAELHDLVGFAAASLLGPQGLVAGGIEDQIEGALVVAAVVGGPAEGLEGEGVGPDEVHPSHLGGVHADLGGEEVHGPLDGGGGLGSARAAVRDGGGGVGDHRPVVELDLRDRVRALRHHPREVREDRADLGVGAALLEHGEPVGLDGAVAPAADLERLVLGPPVPEADHVLAAGLGPAHRPTDPPGEPAEEQLLRVAADLGAEPAADVGSDHPHLGLVEPVGGGERVAHAVGVLRARPLHQPIVDPRRRRRAALEGHGGHPLVHRILLDDHVAAVEEVVGAPEGEVDDEVGARGLVDHHLVGEGVGRVDDGLERLVVGPHELGGVGPLLRPLAHDDGDGLADEAHHVAREERARHGGVEERHARREVGQVDVGGGEDAEHPRLAAGLVHLDRGQLGVGDGRPHVGDVDGPVELGDAQVGDVGAALGEQLRVLDPHHAITEETHWFAPPPGSRPIGAPYRRLCATPRWSWAAAAARTATPSGG